jgi:chromosomal replication initiation ATPase DnaA
LVLYLARRVCGLGLRELANAAGMMDYSAVSIAVRRLEKRLRRNTAERDQFQRICHLLNVEM